jgi:hypothetical protein
MFSIKDTNKEVFMNADPITVDNTIDPSSSRHNEPEEITHIISRFKNAKRYVNFNELSLLTYIFYYSEPCSFSIPS